MSSDYVFHFNSSFLFLFFFSFLFQLYVCNTSILSAAIGQLKLRALSISDLLLLSNFPFANSKQTKKEWREGKTTERIFILEYLDNNFVFDYAFFSQGPSQKLLKVNESKPKRVQKSKWARNETKPKGDWNGIVSVE